ncbi:NACHT, LRR and PYD domains-containing protein 3-like [Spea bombifrons]|uniref:NACHT, LRR and PYD domains-containing protein 3-like n=1 Tax=Spea bombifrons TaxID=233779 RepID=UPI00234967CC|nr:NACHT, LRR and PYD domains-containing protein 3-like [Spea bombifrons]
MGEELVACDEKGTAPQNWQLPSESFLLFLQKHRVQLVEDLGDCIDCIAERGLQENFLSKDDYEEIVYERGPRNQVRKLLDIICCLGEEHARFFCTISKQIKSTNSKKQVTKNNEYPKLIQKHKDVLLRRNEYIKYYNSRHGEKYCFSDHFVNLLLVNGHYTLEIKKNELLTFGQQRIHLQNKKETKLDLRSDQLLQKLHERCAPKRILVSGVAGIGKSVFVQKILYDFANKKAYSKFDFALNLTFRDLNLINKPTTLREIICKKHGHLSQILDEIFNNSEKLLMIFDGFDEFRFCSQVDLDQYVFDPDERAELPQIFSSLLKGELLPEASIVVTSRPTVLSHIPVDCIDRFVVITGFSGLEIEDYFQKFYRDNVKGTETFGYVSENHFLFTLCYIPAFCWIVCSVLNESSALHIEQPKTMTDIYCHYLVVLLKYHTRQVDSTKHEAMLNAIIGLGQLAYNSLLQHKTLFYGHDSEIINELPNDIVNSFLDNTFVQELDCTENVLSFTHLTIQEFFAAFYYAYEVNLSYDIMDTKVQEKLNIGSGHLDLFIRFLSGLLSVRNQSIFQKHLRLNGSEKVESYTLWLIECLNKSCEKGYFILNLLHCFFEQQRSCLVRRIKPAVLRLNMSDSIFSPIDLDVLTYFLGHVDMDIEELDLTATHVNAHYLTELLPYLNRCKQLWVGENNLDLEAIKVICKVLASPDCKMKQLGLGWTELEDNGFLMIYRALKYNQSLEGLWVEGNCISYTAVEEFSEIPSFNSTLKYAVLLGNELKPDDLTALATKPHRRVIVAQIDNDFGQEFWKGWWDWIFQRCKMCNDEKIVAFLTKVYRGLGLCLGKNTGWMGEWYIELDNFLQERIMNCSINNIKKRIETLKQMFLEQSTNL